MAQSNITKLLQLVKFDILNQTLEKAYIVTELVKFRMWINPTLEKYYIVTELVNTEYDQIKDN